MTTLTITVPKGYSRETVAEIFAAYLLDIRSFDNFRPAPDQARRYGPFRKETSVGDNRWQLDGGNDYFLEFNEDQATLSHRYNNEKKCAALVTLFQAMHPLVATQMKTEAA